MKQGTVTRRRYWVVSPNVRFNSGTVSDWRQASVKWKAAFMGWAPDDPKHKLGLKFARVIQPNDIILIARRHKKKQPEVVGFGVVVGRSRRGLKGLNPPQSFGTLRTLSPFVPLTESPSRLRLMDGLDQVAALHELHPEIRPSHKRICEWMEQRLLYNPGFSQERRLGSKG